MSDEPTERDVEALQGELREAERTAEHWEGLWHVAIERAEAAERRAAQARREGAAEAIGDVADWIHTEPPKPQRAYVELLRSQAKALRGDA